MPEIQDRVWRLIERLQVGVGKAKLVAGSKALHHLLPELVPPIDRQYTVSYFFGSPGAIQGKGKEYTAFQQMYPVFHHVQRSSADQIASRLNRRSWNTSSTKLVDNAIVGYQLEERERQDFACLEAFLNDAPYDEKQFRRAAKRFVQNPGVKTLSPAEERLLPVRLAIGHHDRLTARKAAIVFKTTEEEVRALEAKAIRKLMHPSRNVRLRTFLAERPQE